jgi:hypothetical protein
MYGIFLKRTQTIYYLLRPFLCNNILDSSTTVGLLVSPKFVDLIGLKLLS